MTPYGQRRRSKGSTKLASAAPIENCQNFRDPNFASKYNFALEALRLSRAGSSHQRVAALSASTGPSYPSATRTWRAVMGLAGVLGEEEILKTLIASLLVVSAIVIGAPYLWQYLLFSEETTQKVVDACSEEADKLYAPEITKWIEKNETNAFNP